jgi:uncharacterized protein YqcC (DUF446 family)
MTNQTDQITHTLRAIEYELRQLNYWQELPLPKESYASELPFSHDTMEFPQWLQFVFLQRMWVLIETEASLPSICGITPYAEEYFKQLDTNTKSLLKHLVEIDALLTTHNN